MNEETQRILEEILKQVKLKQIKKIPASKISSYCDNEEIADELFLELEKKGLIADETNEYGLKPNEEIVLIQAVQVGTEAQKILKNADSSFDENIIKELEKRVFEKEKAYEKLHNAFYGYMIRIAKSFYPSYEQQKDFIAEAEMGFYEAVSEFNLNNVNTLSTFAWGKMMRNCQDAKERKYASISMPHIMHMRMKQLKRYREKCETEKHTFDYIELGKMWGLPTKTAEDIELIKFNMNLIDNHGEGAESLDVCVAGDSSKPIALVEMISDNSSSPDSAYIRRDKFRTAHNYLYSLLDQEEQAVFILTTLLHYKIDDAVVYLNKDDRWKFFNRTEPFKKTNITGTVKKFKLILEQHKKEFAELLK